MKISDHLCIKLICDAYNGISSFDNHIEVDFVKVYVKEFDDTVVVVFPGSESFIDWQRDFDADMVMDEDIGLVEHGFYTGMRAVKMALKIPTNKNMVITGHSLGAARALIYAGLLASKGLLDSKDCIVTFGSPRPGADKLKEVLAGIPIRSYRNRHDIVTTVPVTCAIFPYVHPRDLIPVDQPPKFPDAWGLLADHHSELYLAAMANNGI